MQRHLHLLLLIAVFGCGGYKPPTLGACGDGTSLDEEECSAGSFVANDRCFPTLQAACGCLGCQKKDCSADNSKPADVTCGTDAPLIDSLTSGGEEGEEPK